MIDSIYIGMSGLNGFSRGLKVIANNTANLNTPGFKSSSLQFADAFYNTGQGGNIGTGQSGQFGYGLNTGGTTMSFLQGDERQTSNNLDVAIDGHGMFVLKDTNGNITYSRDGQFQFNKDGVLVNSSSQKVMGTDANGNMSEITISGQNTLAGKATANVVFTGNLSSTATTAQTVSGITVYDANGGTHTLTASITNTNSTATGSFQVQLMEGAVSVGMGTIVFDSTGKPKSGSAKISVTFTPSTPAGAAAIPLTLDFSGQDVTSFASGSLSSLAVKSNDGSAASNLSSTAFDATGALVMTYANGQTVTGSKLSLMNFDTPDALESVGNNQFRSTNDSAIHLGTSGSGALGTVKGGYVEISNVNLSQEFSDLVVVQRGYQASSQIISTANDMLAQLFAMKK